MVNVSSARTDFIYNITVTEDKDYCCGGQGFPVTEEVLPVTEEVFPVTEEVRLFTEEGIPVTEKGILVTEEVFPVTEEVLPVVEDKVCFFCLSPCAGCKTR